MVWDFGSIFYRHNVVGGVVYCRHDIYGGGIHRTRRYSGVYRCIRLNKLSSQKKFIDYIFGDIFYEHTISRMLL